MVDIADPRNPRIVGGFDAGQRIALTDSNLLVANGLNLEVYGLTNPAQPNLVGSAPGVSGTYPVRIDSFGNFAFIHTLIYGWDNWGTILFIRGDLEMFDISDPTSPQALGLLFNSSHSDYPQYPGSDYCDEPLLAVLSGMS